MELCHDEVIGFVDSGLEMVLAVLLEYHIFKIYNKTFNWSTAEITER